MNRYARKIDRLARAFPDARRGLLELQTKVLHAREEQQRLELLSERLDAMLGSLPSSRLALLKAEAVRLGILLREIRVNSPQNLVAVRRYSSIEDVPDEVEDPTTGESFEVTPTNLQVVYRSPD